MKRVFLDSSVLFTAVNSPAGGSAKLFTLSNISLLTSPVVLAEVERNVRKKLQAYHLERFFVLVKHLTILTQLPDKRQITRAQRVIVEKDAVILAEAKMSPCTILVTLDRKHFFTEEVRTFVKPMRILTPKDLIESEGNRHKFHSKSRKKILEEWFSR